MTLTSPSHFTRRDFVRSSLALTVAGMPLRRLAAADPPREKIPVAAVVTVYRRASHADVIVGKILEGWRQDGGDGPNLKLVSLYVDQIGADDLSADLAKKHGFRQATTVEDALTLGTGRLAVGGVLIVGEHGNYPSDPKTQQVMYPRRRFFDDVAAVFRKTGEVVPVFNDKHLAAHWRDARHMYDVSRELKIPFMAGSSVPVMWRKPAETIPLASEITEGIALGYGPLEHYGFHALEGLQCLMERRKGGETGVRSVQAVRGEGIWDAERKGRWSKGLFDAVVAHSPTPYNGAAPRPAEMAKDAVFYLIDYKDGTKGTVAMGTGFTHDFACGVALRGEEKPFTVTFLGQDGPPYGHFAALLAAVEGMIQTGKPSYPVERTLLTTGILDAALHSWAEESRRIDTPELAIAYDPVDWPFPLGDVPPTREQ
jgi:hypothetical protein